MEKFANSVNWFEIPVLNFEQAKEFYSRISYYEMYEETIGGFRMGFLPMDILRALNLETTQSV